MSIPIVSRIVLIIEENGVAAGPWKVDLRGVVLDASWIMIDSYAASELVRQEAQHTHLCKRSVVHKCAMGLDDRVLRYRPLRF